MYLYIDMCFNNKYKYRTLNGGHYYIIKNKTSRKRKKKKLFERLYGAVSQFFVQKYYTRQNNTSWCGTKLIFSTKNHDAGGLRWTKY